MATATPREALAFSASMRLPSTVTREQISEKVDKLLEDLGIMVCADVMIGGALIKGISGGQRKRTSVGVELITNPSVFFSYLLLSSCLYSFYFLMNQRLVWIHILHLVWSAY